MWFIPSRERPHKLEEFLQAARETGMSTPLSVLIDETEPCTYEYRALSHEYSFNLVIKDGETIGAAGRINHAFELHRDLAWYGFLTDDCEPATQGWDVVLSKECMPDRIAFPWSDLPKQKYGIFAIGGALARAVGFIVPPGMEHYGGDRFWKTIAARLGRGKLLRDVVVKLPYHVREHDNPREWDAPKKRQKNRQSEDKAVWLELRESGWVSRLVKKVQENLQVTV